MQRALGEVVAVCISEGGIPRVPVPEIRLTFSGIEGDGHLHIEHFTPDRAVTLFSFEQIQQFSSRKLSFSSGSAGENVSVKGLDLSLLEPGDYVEIGPTLLRVTKPFKPCYAQEAQSEQKAENDQEQKGVFASIVRPGRVQSGDHVIVMGQSIT